MHSPMATTWIHLTNDSKNLRKQKNIEFVRMICIVILTLIVYCNYDIGIQDSTKYVPHQGSIEVLSIVTRDTNTISLSMYE